jgi:hypothetical protein
MQLHMGIRRGTTVMRLTMGLATIIGRTVIIATIHTNIMEIGMDIAVGEVGIAGAVIMADGVAEADMAAGSADSVLFLWTIPSLYKL